MLQNTFVQATFASTSATVPVTALRLVTTAPTLRATLALVNNLFVTLRETQYQLTWSKHLAPMRKRIIRHVSMTKIAIAYLGRGVASEVSVLCVFAEYALSDL